MSKTSLKKTVRDFDAGQLQHLLIEVYTRCKDAKEYLDFFVDPDVNAKAQAARNAIEKEVGRVYRHRHKPRMPKIKTAVKKFALLDPGDEYVADLMLFACQQLVRMADGQWIAETTLRGIDRFLSDTITYCVKRNWQDTYLPPLYEAVEAMKAKNLTKLTLRQTLARWIEVD